MVPTCRSLLLATLLTTLSLPAWAQCAGDAQAAELADRYVANEGTLYDKQTNLTWQRCAVGQQWNTRVGCVGHIQPLNWVDAQKEIHDGWRLPTKDELVTLLTTDCKEPRINTLAFRDHGKYAWKFGRYWTSTKIGAIRAWAIGFGFGGFRDSPLIDSAPVEWQERGGLALRLVRSGPPSAG